MVAQKNTRSSIQLSSGWSNMVNQPVLHQGRITWHGLYTNIAPHAQNVTDVVESDLFKELIFWASLVAQWLRICLLMQGTRVRALVWEDPTCHGAAGPVSHNC